MNLLDTVFTYLTMLITPILVRRQIAWIEATEKRLGIIVNTVATIKGIKMMGLTAHVQDVISSLRVEEVLQGK